MSSIPDDGVIKYKCFHTPGIITNTSIQLMQYRDLCFKKKWIGAYSNGIGYGNISQKTSTDKFVISSTQTGGVPLATEEHFSEVNDYSIDHNWIKSSGIKPASSEALTHAAIYQISSKFLAIIHIHNRVLWKRYLFKKPTTGSEIPYGTPEMAQEILALHHKKPQERCFIMAGHEEGIIAFGESLDIAYQSLLKLEKN
jgi:ribulose-5-phosphate 4-epimerase/fuculose-1-phosphate aldolase